MRRVALGSILLAVFLAPPHSVVAGPPAEIRLGKAPTPQPHADPAQVRAIERFFSARQSASMDRTRLAAVRRMMAGPAQDGAVLAGDPGHILTAFDFTDGAIERMGNGRFQVMVYLLFSDRQGRVVESRDEALTFAGQTCTSLQVVNTLRWGSEEVEKSARRLHVDQALDRADDFLQEWATRQTRLAAFSIEDVYPTGVNRVMIPCLQFASTAGKRGYDVVDAPIMIRRGPKGYLIEPRAN
jgi:hypothetical protein